MQKTTSVWKLLGRLAMAPLMGLVFIFWLPLIGFWVVGGALCEKWGQHKNLSLGLSNNLTTGEKIC